MKSSLMLDKTSLVATASFAAGAALAAAYTLYKRRSMATASSPRVFKLERFFAKYEFNAKYQLCNSDVSSMSLKELLALCAEDKAGIRAWEDLWLGYTESQGLPELLHEIASTYQGIKPENVIECVPAEGILLSAQATVGMGDVCIVTWPAYQSLYEVAQSRGADVRFWKVRGGGPERLKFHVEDLAAEVERVTRSGKRVKFILINFPHNPTGCSLALGELIEVVDIARRCDAFLMGDEMYRGLEYDGQPTLPAVCEIYEKGLSLSGMSKVYALPGLRVGWLVSKHEGLVAEIAKLKDFTTICGSAPSEVLALIALRQREALLKRSRKIIAEGLQAVEAFVARHPELLYYHRPDAGPICYPTFKGDSIDAEDVLKYAEDLVDQHGVLIMPAGVCYEIPDDGSNQHLAAGVRFGFGRTDCAANLEVYEKALQEERFRVCAPAKQRV